jgi:hypothetical protein
MIDNDLDIFSFIITERDVATFRHTTTCKIEAKQSDVVWYEAFKTVQTAL